MMLAKLAVIKFSLIENKKKRSQRKSPQNEQNYQLNFAKDLSPLALKGERDT